MRRPKGEGSVVQTATGKYRARIEVEPMNGRRRWLSTTRDTAPEARKALRELLRDKEVLEVQQQYKDVFPAVVNDFILACKIKQLKETTVMRYEYILKYWSDIFKYKETSNITTKDIDNGIKGLQDKQWQNGSIRVSVIVLGCLFNYLIRHNRLTTNPIKYAAIPRKTRNKKNMQIIDSEEHKRILEYLKPLYDDFLVTGFKPIRARMYVVYLLTYNTGMREGEVAGLTWGSLDATKNELAVHQQVVRGESKCLITSPKTEASYREVVISPKLVEVLKGLHEAYLKFGYQTSFIFGNLYEKDTPTAPAAIARLFKDCLKAAGIERHITFHDLRHTHATTLLEMDISVNTVSERIGHAYASTTFDIYGHVLKQSRERAAAVCEDF